MLVCVMLVDLHIHAHVGFELGGGFCLGRLAIVCVACGG